MQMHTDPYPIIEQLGTRISLAKRALERAHSRDFKMYWQSVYDYLLRRLEEQKRCRIMR